MARRPKAPEFAVCCPDKPHYAKGMCRPHYDRYRWSGKLPAGFSAATSLAQVVAEDIGAASEHAVKLPRRANRKPERETPRLRLERPAVAKHVAAVLVKNGMDAEETVKELKPGLGIAEVKDVAEKIERSPEVQEAVQEELRVRGLDEESKQEFVNMLWRFAQSTDPDDEKRQLMAWRLLGRVFMPESQHAMLEKPEALPIRGFEQDIARMMGDEEANADNGAFSHLVQATKHANSTDQ